MNFSRDLVESESLATKSKIRVLPLDYFQRTSHDETSIPHQKVQTDDENDNDDDKALDRMVIQSTNDAALDLLKCSTSSVFTERLLPLQTTIQPGDLVVIMEAFDRLDFVYAETDAVFTNRNGHFHHNDFIGKPFGCKIRSKSHRGYGFIYLLRPTPELWARSLNHRTQIVHELDQAQIIFQLYLKPNMTVVESGTGSGAMSHAILRTIAPQGHLHTFEFNHMRSETARREFAKNGVSHLVTVYHKDVCTEGFQDLLPHSVDAVFLDLPEPWLALEHAARVLKSSGRIATYSPCVEQTQRTVQALTENGFHSMRTMEFRLQEHYVDQVEYESPPTEKRPRLVTHDIQQYHSTQEENDGDGDEHDGVHVNTASAESGKSKNSEQAATSLGASEESNDEESSIPDCQADKAPKVSAQQPSIDTTHRKKKRTITVARPFVSMRGHTAFLTFATAPVAAAATAMTSSAAT